jgi:uncharacterized protein (DUF1778 family)
MVAAAEPVNPRLQIRVDPELQRLIRAAAGLANMTATEWIRERLMRDARAELKARGLNGP